MLPFGMTAKDSTMAGEEPITPATPHVRQIDASLRTLAIESLRAIIGILIAFSVSWWISGALHLRSGFGGYAGTAAIFVVAALVALTITSGLPIHDALAAQRSEIARQQGLLQAAADGHQFNSDLHTALEMAEREPDVLQVIGRALDLVSDGPGELLLADSSQAHLHQGAASVTTRGPRLRRQYALGMSSCAARTDPRVLRQRRVGDLSSPAGATGTGIRALCTRDSPGHIDRCDSSDQTGRRAARYGATRSGGGPGHTDRSTSRASPRLGDQRNRRNHRLAHRPIESTQPRRGAASLGQ